MNIQRAAEPMGEWGRRAARLYDERYATRYSESDGAAASDAAIVRLSAWLADVCAGFGRPIAVLDLGCGTGRYFRALNHVRDLVGVDASESMLDRAQLASALVDPAPSVTLVRGDLETCVFERERFDIVYSIGVLAEHAPLTGALVRRVFTWLAPGGVFAFTAVHPESFSIVPSWKRRIGRRAMALAPRSLRQRIRERWLAGGMYADEASIADTLTSAGFLVDPIERLVDVHLHCVAIGRKPAAP
jgi:SAM-dependent methyltransferase